MSSDTPERTLLQDKTGQLTGSWEDEVADTAGTGQPGGHGGGDGSLGEVVQGHGHCCSGDQALHYCVRLDPRTHRAVVMFRYTLKPSARLTKGVRTWSMIQIM